MANSIINQSTPCSVDNYPDKIHSLQNPVLSRCQSLRYDGGFISTKIASLSSDASAISIDGNRLSINYRSLVVNDKLAYSFIGLAGVSKPLDLSSYQAALVEDGVLYLLRVISYTEAEVLVFPALSNGLFDLNSPSTIAQIDFLDLPGRTKCFFIHRSIGLSSDGVPLVGAKSNQAFTIQDTLFSMPLSDDIFVVASPSGIFYVTEQLNDRTVQGAPTLFGYTLKINGANLQYIDGSYAMIEKDPVSGYLYHRLTVLHDRLTDKKGIQFDPIAYYERRVDQEDWVSVSFPSSNLGLVNQRVYSECFHPREPMILLCGEDNIDPAAPMKHYAWQRFDRQIEMERGNYNSRVQPATDSSPKMVDKDFEVYVSDLASKFNRVYYVNSSLDTGSVHTPYGIVFLGGKVFCASAYGVIVSPESVTQSVHISVASIGGNEVAYYNITLADGSFTVVAVGLDVPLEITQLNQTLYQVNVASAVNTFRVNANGLVDSFVNSVDWNNRVKPEQVLAFNGSIYDHTIADQSVLSWNSAYNGNYEIGKGVSTSLLYGSPIITSMSPSNEILHSLNNIYWYEYPRDYQVDYYFNRTNVNDMDTVPEYVTTDFLRVEVALEGLRFPEPALETIILASPVNVSIGSSFAEYSVIKYLTYNYFGLRWNGEFKPSYFMSALVQNGVEVFYLVGTFFTYDGWTIRKVVMDSRGSLVSEIVPIAKAAGLKLVGVSSDAVYFWSDYDRVLYTYAGDYVLTPVKAITHFGKLKKSVFSQYDDILGLAFEGGFLLIRHGLESTYDIVVDELVDTKLGMAYRVGGGWYLFNPIDFSFPNQVDSILPVVLESEWLGGQNEFQVVTLKRIRVRGLSSSLITVQVAALDRIAKVDNEIQYQVQDSYGEVQVVPSTQTALAYKIVVSADDFVSAVEFEWDTVTGVAPRFNGGF